MPLVQQGHAGSLAEAAVRFAITHRAMGTILVGMATNAEFEQALAAVNKGTLSQAALDSWRRCSAASSARHASPGHAPVRLVAMVVRRVAWMPPTLLGLVLIVFTISHVIPSDPARVMAGENAPPEQVEALRHQFGLDLPLPLQFARYVRDVATGNMGTSLFTQRPVAEDLWRACRRRSSWRCAP